MSGVSGGSVTSAPRRLSLWTLQDYSAFVEQDRKSVPPAERQQQLVSLEDGLLSRDRDVQLQTMSNIRNLLCDANAPYREIVETGAYGTCLNFLAADAFSNLQLEAIIVIGLMFKSPVPSNELYVEHVVHTLINMVGEGHRLRAEAAMKSIITIASRGDEDRNILIHMGFVEKVYVAYHTTVMQDIIDPEMPTLLKTIHTVCQKPLDSLDRSIMVFELVFDIMLMNPDDDIMEASCSTILHILPNDPSAAKTYKNRELPFLRMLVDSLWFESPDKVFLIMSVIEKISVHCLDLAELISRPVPLNQLGQFVMHKEIRIRRSACRILRNVTRQNAESSQAVVAAEIVPVLYHASLFCQDSGVRKEAARALVTIMYSCTPADCRGIYGYCLEAATRLMKDPLFDLICLDSIDKLLKTFGVDVIERRKQALVIRMFEDFGGAANLKRFVRRNPELRQKAASILHDHFPHHPPIEF